MQQTATELSSATRFDVVIMGGGYAGLVQALHLTRVLPKASIAIIEPRTPDEIAAIDKIGESTVEIAANFMTRDLGLANYLAGTCPPKYGLNFHWAKQEGTTETANDYFSSWVPQGPKIPCFQLHRGRFERDVTKMVAKAGVHFVRGKVSDFSFGEGEDHTVTATTGEGEEQTLTAGHLVDACGRAFLIGRKRDTIRRKPEDLYGLDSFASWIRVKGVDPSLIESTTQTRRSSVSGYFATNHFFGDGHWVWTIPLCGKENILSIGVVAHRQRHSTKDLATKEKLLAFLEKHHGVVHALADSGEVEDFKALVRPAHISDEMLGEDNWYTIGDAAHFNDPFYSMGTSSIAFMVTSVTEVIRAKMAGEPDAEDKRSNFNHFNIGWARTSLHTVRDHYKHLGNASAMSWRIYFEYIWWFGFWVPMFIGRWHLQPEFLKRIDPTNQLDFIQECYEDLHTLVERGQNAGFADPYREDILAGPEFCPPKDDTVDYLADSAYEPQRLNIYRALGMTLRKSAWWVVRFQWKLNGVSGLLRPRTIRRVGFLLGRAIGCAFFALEHDLKSAHRKKDAFIEDFDREFQGYVPPRLTSATDP
ncbi:MAG: tryptophan 7-halogenase [Deltaproteobacteria bacterium]|nr:tryptophan 7-halogenase [Deltaproteobacteria bacterium]